MGREPQAEGRAVVRTERMRPLWLGVEVRAAGKHRPPCQAQAAPSHPFARVGAWAARWGLARSPQAWAACQVDPSGPSVASTAGAGPWGGWSTLVLYALPLSSVSGLFSLDLCLLEPPILLAGTGWRKLCPHKPLATEKPRPCPTMAPDRGRDSLTQSLVLWGRQDWEGEGRSPSLGVQ